MHARALAPLAAALALALLAPSSRADDPPDTPSAQEATVDRGDLGVTMSDQDGHAVVTEVQPGSPAEKAGIQTGDLILEIEGTTVTDMSPLVELIRARKPGTMTRFLVERDGWRREFAASLGALPAIATPDGEPVVDEATVRAQREAELRAEINAEIERLTALEGSLAERQAQMLDALRAVTTAISDAEKDRRAVHEALEALKKQAAR